MTSSQDQSVPECLIILYAPDTALLGREYALESFAKEITVGRHRENTIVIESSALSRRHARFEKRADGWWVVDGSSTNGTYLNEEKVQSARLRLGDRVKVGDTIFKLGRREEEGFIDVVYSSSPIDGLTKAYNRRHLLEQIDRALRGAERPLALIMFDLDHFKRINDTYGHFAGDQVLRETASLTQQHTSPGEVFARYGGEEFALLLPGMGLQGAAARAEEIRAAIAAHVVTFAEHTIPMTISLGVAQADEGARLANDLIRAADEKLYAAKYAGRNCVRW